jgi:hypothetical protein
MCSKEIDAQLDASLDEKLTEFRPGVHDTSVLLHAVRVSMPATFGSEDQRAIHCANRPFSFNVNNKENQVLNTLTLY